MGTVTEITPTAATTNIRIPYPEASEIHLWLAIGACKLRVTPGETGAWVAGSYTDLSESLPLLISQDGGTVMIHQEQNWSEMMGLLSRTPTMELVIGGARPFSLTIETAASDSYIDLGGLPLTYMKVSQGANKNVIDFSAPNPVEMSRLQMSAGAGSVELRNLGNANFAEMRLDGGAAEFKIDFSGQLREYAHAKIPAGLSAISIDVPSSTPAKIVGETVMGGMHISGPLTLKDGALWTNAGLATNAPQLLIEASVALGSLNFRAV